MSAHAAKCIRTAAPATVVGPGRAARVIRAEVLRTLPVHVYRIPAHVSVIGIAAVSVVVTVVGMVVGIVVAVAVVIATVVVAAVPGGISVVPTAVVHNSSAVPATIPTAVAPGAAPTAHHRAHRDSGTESNDARSRHVARGIRGSYIPRNDIRRSVNQGGVVLRNVNNLWIGGLNDNHLW